MMYASCSAGNGRHLNTPRVLCACADIQSGGTNAGEGGASLHARVADVQVVLFCTHDKMARSQEQALSSLTGRCFQHIPVDIMKLIMRELWDSLLWADRSSQAEQTCCVPQAWREGPTDQRPQP